MYTTLSTVFFAASALAIPTNLQNRAEQTCTEQSTKVTEWTVNNFDYHAGYTFSTPAHQISSGYVNFTLSNPALDVSPTCYASSTRLEDFFYGDMVYNCTNSPAVAASGKRTVTGAVPYLTQFTYNRASGEVKINQTWDCPEEGSQFKAEGGATFKLACTTTEYQNPNWTEGEIYSSRNIECDEVTGPAKIESLQAAA